MNEMKKWEDECVCEGREGDEEQQAMISLQGMADFKLTDICLPCM